MLALAVISVLLVVLGMTMVERKILNYVQNCKGPKKIGFLGLINPLSDAFKLVLKESRFPVRAKVQMFVASPVIFMVLMLVGWYFFPFFWSFSSVEYSCLFYMGVASMGVLFVILSAFGSKKKYSLVGAIRLVSNVVTYEIGVVFMILFFICCFGSYDLFSMSYHKVPFFWYWLLLFFCWFAFGIMETNRAPFDYAEGESEIVSGYNVEYGGLGFACFYLAEYGKIFLFCLLTSYLWF